MALHSICTLPSMFSFPAAAEVSKATVSAIDYGNKILRMAKANSDVSLQYSALGDINDSTFVTYADAAYYMPIERISHLKEGICFVWSIGPSLPDMQESTT